MRALRTYRTVADALEALARDCVVDEVENALPKNVADALERRARTSRGSWWDEYEDEIVQPRLHVRYVGAREVRWFDAEASA